MPNRLYDDVADWLGGLLGRCYWSVLCPITSSKLHPTKQTKQLQVTRMLHKVGEMLEPAYDSVECA